MASSGHRNKNAVIDIHMTVNAHEPIDLTSSTPAINTIVSSSVSSSLDNNYFDENDQTPALPKPTVKSVSFHSSLDDLLPTILPDKSLSVAASTVSSNSMESGQAHEAGSDSASRQSSKSSFSSVGSVASNAVGTSVSTKLETPKQKISFKDFIFAIPSLFFGKQRPSFLLVLLLFIGIAVTAPVASTLIMNIYKVRGIEKDQVQFQAQEIAQWTKQEFETMLMKFEGWGETNAVYLAEQTIKVFTEADIENTRHIIFGPFRANSGIITGLILAYNEKVWGHNLTPQGRGWVYTFPNKSACEYDMDIDGHYTGSFHWCVPRYNATVKPWWVQVSKPGGPRHCWTGMYISPITGLYRVMYSVALTAENDTDKIIYVSSSEVLLSNVGNLITNNVGQAERGLACIIDENDVVLGCSDPNIHVLEGLTPLKIQDVNDSTIQPVSEYVIKNWGSWQAAAAANASSWVGQQIVSTIKIERACLSWNLFVIYEPKTVTVDKNALAVALSITAVALVLSVLLSFLISAPLHRLVKDMNNLTCLVFDHQNDRAFLKESAEIQTKYLQLRAGLIAMTKYLPRSVVAKVLSNPAQQLLSMETKKLTILFVDIQGFTTISEAYPRHKVVKLLNQWIEVFTKIVHFNNGTIDKYIGDCIMAIWGAPEDVKDTEYLASKTALEFMNAVPLLNDHWRENQFPTINIRVGVHAGSALVGNIGCQDRMNYTVCGNAANVASRLEQLGKELEVTPLISSAVAEHLGNRLFYAWVGRMRLKGHKHLKYNIYHLLGPAAGISPVQLKAATSFQKLEKMFGSDQHNTAEIKAVLTEMQNDQDFIVYKKVLEMLQKENEEDTAGSEIDQM